MKDTDLLRRGALGLAALGLPVLLSVLLALPVVVTVLLVGVAAAAVVVIERLRRPYPVPWPAPAQPPAPVQPPAATATTLVRGTLPSNTTGYSFQFSGTMTWEPLPNPHGPWHADPAAIGEQVLVTQAAEVTTSCTLSDPDGARRRLAELLGTPRDDELGRVRAWVTDVAVAVDEKDAERFSRLTGLRKDEVLWEQQRGHERSLRKYLSEDALATTGSAMVWWLARHLDDVDQAVSLVQNLHQLSRVARGDLDDLRVEPSLFYEASRPDTEGLDASSPASTVRPSAGGLVDELFPNDSDERRLFVQELGRLLNGAGCTEQEQDLRAAFDIPRADV